MGKRTKIINFRKRQMVIALLNISTILFIAVYDIFIKIRMGYSQHYILTLFCVVFILIILLMEFSVLFIETNREDKNGKR